MKETETTSRSLVIRADAHAEHELHFSHPLNPRSQITGVRLGFLAGLRQTGVNLTRVPPGKESFIYHAHSLEEEWIYILAGRGVVEIDGAEHELGPGDFAGFPLGVAHHLRNPFDTELVYLSGGDRRDLDVVRFPREDTIMVRSTASVELYPASAAVALMPDTSE